MVNKAELCPVCGYLLDKLGKEPYIDSDGFITSKTVFACNTCRQYYEINEDTGRWI